MKASTRLIITRHGQTNYNLQHKLDGQHDTKLTALGKKQAKKLAKTLKKFKLDRVYSSPLTRAVETAQYILKETVKENATNLEIVPEFSEIDCGSCTALTKKEIKKKFPKLVEEWEKNSDPPFPQGESLKDVEKRAIPVLKRIIEKNKGKTILISGHGSLNLAIIGCFLCIPHGLRFKIKQSNCCINEIELNGKDLKITKLNCEL